MEIDGIILNQKTWDEMKQDKLLADGVRVLISKHLPDNMQILISDGHIVAIIKDKEEEL